MTRRSDDDPPREPFEQFGAYLVPDLRIPAIPSTIPRMRAHEIDSVWTQITGEPDRDRPKRDINYRLEHPAPEAFPEAAWAPWAKPRR